MPRPNRIPETPCPKCGKPGVRSVGKDRGRMYLRYYHYLAERRYNGRARSTSCGIGYLHNLDTLVKDLNTGGQKPTTAQEYQFIVEEVVNMVKAIHSHSRGRRVRNQMETLLRKYSLWTEDVEQMPDPFKPEENTHQPEVMEYVPVP